MLIKKAILNILIAYLYYNSPESNNCVHFRIDAYIRENKTLWIYEIGYDF